MESVIVFDHVSKLFRKQNQRTLKELLPAILGRQSTAQHFWALKDISLDIKKGETVGIIGANGSGKSTLLKLIAGVSQPTKGSVQVRGRVAPLIELGAGFHPELTGRENIYLNGIILGLSRSEVESKFSEIVEFAELYNFIDQPVKHYSSGMYLRLAFSVSISVSADILLIDEVLAVGDHAFKQKCYSRLEELQRKGLTIVIVSHAEGDIKKYCDKAILISSSELVYFGDVNHALELYRQQISKTSP